MTSRPAAQRPMGPAPGRCSGNARPWPARVAASALFLLLLHPGGGVLAQTAGLLVSADSSTRRIPEDNVLARVVTLRLDNIPLGLALARIAREGNLRLSYSSDVVPLTHRVTLSRTRTPVGDVLREALAGTHIDPVTTPSGYVVLVRNPGSPALSPAGSVPHGPLPALVSSRDQLSVRSTVMDRVIVMGTPAMGAPERELASAVTVLTSSQIEAYGPASMQDLLRAGIPGLVTWDLGISGPFAQIGSVRGSSSFTANYLKTYVDGVELASPYLLFAVDPYSIERIEIIRGPQGSALYGSDAISGVVHVVTRKGSPSAGWRPQLDAQLSGGLMESRYATGAVPSQRHSAAVSTGGGLTSLGVGGTWAAAGGIVPDGHSGYRSLFGGFRQLAGFLRVEGTMRYADVRFTAPANPLLRNDSLFLQVRSVQRDQRIEDETYGLTLDAQPVEGIRHTLVIGLDRHEGAIPLQREPATVADALLGATRERAAKVSVRFSTALRIVEHEKGGLTLTLGTDHTDLSRERLGIRSDVAGSGDELEALYHDDIANQGVFVQLKGDVARRVFLSAGLRGDWNSTFGENLGVAWSPMLGISTIHDSRGLTYKLRAAYGRGIRPPAPSARLSISTLRFHQIANPMLQPESQSGLEGGLEIFAGDHASMSLTGYTQVASGLIQQVILGRHTIQYQNVGQILNRGAELEAHVRRGSAHIAATFSVTDSRVQALSSTYSGDLRVGDRVTEVPASSGSASLSWDLGRSQVSLGTVYLGRWTGYDWARYIANQSQESTQLTSLRSYWREYPGLIRPYLSVSHILNNDVEWFARIDNLLNLQRFERDNLQVTAGRTMTVGARIGVRK